MGGIHEYELDFSESDSIAASEWYKNFANS